MSVKVAINGFGRIGRNIYRAALNDPAVDIVAVNDITDAKTLAHLLKYASIRGNLPNRISSSENCITVDARTLRVFKTKDISARTWSPVSAEIVVEASAAFTKGPDAHKH